MWKNKCWATGFRKKYGSLHLHTWWNIVNVLNGVWYPGKISDMLKVCFPSALKIQNESTLWQDSSGLQPCSCFYRREENRGHYLYPFFSKAGDLCVCVSLCAAKNKFNCNQVLFLGLALCCVWVEEYSWSGYLLSSRLMKQHMALCILAIKLPL